MSSERSNQENYLSPLIANLVLLGYWLAPVEILKNQIDYKSRSTKIIAILFMLISSFLIALALLGMIDGPSVFLEVIKMNFLVNSQMLSNYAIYSVLLLWLSVILVGWLLPLFILLIINGKSNKKQEKEIGMILITSCYMFLSFMFYTIVVFSISMLLSISNLEMVELELGNWQNPQFIAFGMLLILGMLFSVKINKKILDFSRIQTISMPISMFIITLTIILVFFVEF